MIGKAGNDLYIFRGDFGHDIIQDSSGTLDSIDLSDFKYSSATFAKQEGNATTGDDLLITIGSNNILVENYFAENSNSAIGTGYIEDIDFATLQDVNMAYISGLNL